MSKTLIMNDDGWSSYMRYAAPMSAEDIVAVTVGPLVGTAVKVYQFCSLGGHAVNYNSAFLPRVGEMMENVDTMHVWRMRETLRHLEKLGTDPLEIVTDACHQHGMACQFSLRMNDRHHCYKRDDDTWWFPELLSPWLDEHPELLLADRALDYSKPAVHEYRIRQIREILESYDVDGIDLNFARFKPWFRTGEEKAGMPLLTQLVRDLSELVRGAGRTLSAHFEYDPNSCKDSGLDVETILSEGLLDQITLGGVGDHTPSAPSDWWVERAHKTGCKVCPGVEGQLHWIPGCGGGGMGTGSGKGVVDGYGPPSIEYVRAVAANHYQSGADGMCFFNFTCADGPYDTNMFTELASPELLENKSKQYVVAVWPWDSQIAYHSHWTSSICMKAGEESACFRIRIAERFAGGHGGKPSAVLTLDVKGLNRIGDVEILINNTVIEWTGYHYNHFEDGCWNDILKFDVPIAALRDGDNVLELRRKTVPEGFAGNIEARKCILEIDYPMSFAPGAVL